LQLIPTTFYESAGHSCLFWPVRYTSGMKTAISIPDELFAQADDLARRLSQSRSELYSRAVREYVAKHAPDRVTESLDLVVQETGADTDFARRAALRTIEQTEW
jgi:predicted transcriptional regulator